MRLTGVVERLVAHAARQRAVADDGGHVIIVARQIARPRHTYGRRQRGGRMARAKGVVFAFRAHGKAAQAVQPAQGIESIAAPGQQLVRVALMTHVKNQLVLGAA